MPDPTPLLYLYIPMVDPFLMLHFIPMIDLRPAKDSSAVLIQFTFKLQY